MKLTRKAFLSGAAAGLAGAAGFLYPGINSVLAAGIRRGDNSPSSLPAASGEVRRLDGADPSFAGGEVISRSGDVLILKSAAAARAVRVPANTVVWKEFDVGPDSIEIGDWVDAKGDPQADGILLARSGWIWVNIGRRDGVLEAITPAGIVVTHRRGTETFELSKRLEVISAATGEPLPGGVTAVRPGARIGTVGIRLRSGGYRVTRLWSVPTAPSGGR